MKVLIINGSPRANGNTDIALREMEKVFAEEGVETKRLNIGTQMIHGCVACNACHRTGKCGFDDVVNRAADILRDCDGLVVGTPVYYASANGTVVSFLDRLFYSAPYDLTMKVGASVAAAGRAQRLTSSTNTSPSAACRSYPASTGTVSTAASRARRRRTPKVSRRCELLRGT